MSTPLLNPAAISFSATSLPVVIVGLMTVALGLYVFVLERGSSIGRRYLFFAWSIGLYVFGAGVSYAVIPRSLSLIWDRIAHIGVAFIPTSLFLASSSLLGLSHRFRATGHVLLTFSVFSAGLALFSDTFIAGNREVWWGYYPVYGPVGIAFVGLFGIVLIGVLVMYVRRVKITTDILHRKRLRATIIAISIGVLASVDFLPAVGVHIYAFGYIPISIFVFIIGFVLVRYRLVDITPELAATSILDTMQGALVVTDRDGIIRVANRVARSWLGLDAAHLMNQRFATVLEQQSTPIGNGLPGDAGMDGQQEWTDSTGTLHIVEINSTPLMLSGGQTVGTVYAAHDITAHKEAQKELARLALYDAMTGLPNRTLLYERIEHSITIARRTNSFIAIFFLDLDRFKEVNDSRGHEAGDEVLRVIAGRLTASVRESDTVSRIGGDEFVIVTDGLSGAGDSVPIAQKLSDTVSRPIDLADGRVEVGSSIGIAMYPIDGRDRETLVAHADNAMYMAKKVYSRRFVSYREIET